MSEDRAELSEWRMPAAAAGALQLSRQLSRPATLAEQMSARGRPLVVGSFGAEIVHRFNTVSAPGVLALSLAERFLPHQSQPSSGELTLAPRGSPQREVGVAHWSDPAAPFAAGSAPQPAREPLLGDLSAVGWGTPASMVPAPPIARRSAEALVAQPGAAPGAIRRSEHIAAQPPPNADPAPTPAAGQTAPTPPEPIRRRADDPQAPAAEDKPDATSESPGDSTDTAEHSPQAVNPIQRSGLQPSEPPAVSRATRSPAARSLDAATPASGATPLARAASPGLPANLPPDLPLLRPVALRATALLRAQPPDPLQRMGVVPQGAAAPTAAPFAGGALPAALAANLPLVRETRETSPATGAPVASADTPMARRTDMAAGTSSPIASGSSATLGPAEPPDLAAANSAPEARAQRSAAPALADEIAQSASTPATEMTRSEAAPAAEIARSEAIPTPVVASSVPASAIEVARSEASKAQASPAMNEVWRIGALPLAGGSGGARLSLTTLMLQRHAAGSSAGGSAPLILLRTRPPLAALQRHVEAAPPRGALVHGAGDSPAAPGNRFDALSIGRSAAEVIFPQTDMPEQTTARGSIDELRLAAAGELTAPATPSVAEPGSVARVADSGALPLLQRSAEIATLAQQTGGLPLLRRHPIFGTESPVAIGAGAASPAGAVWRSVETRGIAGSTGAGLSPLAPAAPLPVAAPPGADGGYEQWSIPELALEQPAAGMSRLVREGASALPLIQRQLAAPAAGVNVRAPAYTPPALDLAQPVRAEVQRAPSEPLAPAPAPPAGAEAPGDTPGQGSSNQNIEAIAQKVYEHLRRRLLVEHERRGRPL